MQAIKKMGEMYDGESAAVTGIAVKNELSVRLRDLGLIEGTVITKLMTAFGGEPSAYYIRGAVIALRKEDTDNITVCEEKSEYCTK